MLLNLFPCYESASNHSCGLLRLMNLKFISIKDPHLASTIFLCYKMQKKIFVIKMNKTKFELNYYSLLFINFSK